MPAENINPSNGIQMRFHSFTNYVTDPRRMAPPSLVPSLLAVNKQIYAEGINILYGHEFVFLDPSALYAFLINLGPSGARHLKSIRLMRWEYGRAKAAYNHACFAVLAWATNLTSFHINAPIGTYRTTRDGADQLYRNAFPWLEAFGAAKGKRDAALDILHLGEKCFPDYRRSHGSRKSPESESHADKVKNFKAAVADCLNKHHDIIVGKPGKPVKKAKKAVAAE